MGAVPLAHVLRPLIESIDPAAYPDLLIGVHSGDDAAVYRLSDELAVIQTTDFFPPIVDDPYTFGAIAAANAMSDVYAMGGQVLLALNIAAFPEDLPQEIVQAIFRGGADKVAEAGGVIAGGHTILDDEPKYGLAVTGLVHPERIVTKDGARPGDRLVLTKPLGTGIISTALRNGAADPEHVVQAARSMMTLNKAASEAMQWVGVHAVTDVTGFGLLGHGLEMAQRSGVGLRIYVEALPLLPGTREYAAEGHVPGGTSRNEQFAAPHIKGNSEVDELTRYVLFDPQTSGGLLIAVPPERKDALFEALRGVGVTAWEVGEITEEPGIEIQG